jgi:hypothetical protein
MYPYDHWKVAKNSEKSNLESETEFPNRQADNDANKCYEISMYFKAGTWLPSHGVHAALLLYPQEASV